MNRTDVIPVFAIVLYFVTIPVTFGFNRYTFAIGLLWSIFVIIARYI